MDATQFDELAQSLARATRRGLLGRVAVLPALGGAAALLGNPWSTAGKKRKKKCKPRPLAKTCAGKCGIVKNRKTCKKKVDCGPCACEANSDCVAAGLGDLCCGGSCFSGVCCSDAACQSDAAPDCVGHACVCATNGDTACAGGAACCPAGCVDLGTDLANCGECGHACQGEQICHGGVCGITCGSEVCPVATRICDGAVCQPCKVCAEGCAFTTVQAAIDAASSGDRITICAGTYSRQGPNSPVADIAGKNLTLVGAGTGLTSTILDGGDERTASHVVAVTQSTSELRAMRITGSNGNAGIGNSAPSQLTLTGVLVTRNDADKNFGGGILNNDRVVLNADTRVTKNTARDGGGIDNVGSTAVLTLKDGSSVTNNAVSTGTAHGIRNGGTVIAEAGSVVAGCLDVGSGTGCPT